ncbi:c-di-GMP-binding flagellar brake protein YcgR, contains PilZNR and PilZ domains [Thermosyntropha lipolytica DSM 11003]|uniref:C-di-GMP-binding flagellar brake protein YcgR, contains PilZNR and PilZ domains n=1 Tax=Thermosyntropha lipolytica DSM 11003 TaxID=1123382 RepID=A0A1M5KY15_9FIRM|nr:flagellar brake domain-containing protein [Thermosyntropha lipolytica]SHG57651.1 c-di-GMP-binding flagellar brake protein YcgR, contains PilZNR and PilZ domains [Thermosyntropha lipolytica DSM 11003]
MEDIRLNQLVEIEYPLEEGVEYLASRVEEIDGDYLHLAVPIRKGQLVPMHIGQKIKVCFTRDDESYAFNTSIVARRREPIPVLIVNKPDKLVKIQRRAYVRIPASIPINYRLIPQGQNFESGMTVDISGGGAFFLSQTKMERGQTLEVEICLPQRPKIVCQAEVKRVIPPEVGGASSYKVAIEFKDITENQRDQIFNFIFEKQREWIKKGLLTEKRR